MISTSLVTNSHRPSSHLAPLFLPPPHTQPVSSQQMLSSTSPPWSSLFTGLPASDLVSLTTLTIQPQHSIQRQTGETCQMPPLPYSDSAFPLSKRPSLCQEALNNLLSHPSPLHPHLPPLSLSSSTDFLAVLTPGPLHLLGAVSPHPPSDVQVFSNVLIFPHINLKICFHPQYFPLSLSSLYYSP